MSTHRAARLRRSKRQRVQALHPIDEQPRPRGRPAPRDVFMMWLMLLPEGADQRQAAMREISRIDASRADTPDTDELRQLFVDLSASG